MTIAVVIRARAPHRRAEALRAALGLTLRDARVVVVLDGFTADDPTLPAVGRRALATLAAFGHPIETAWDAVATADRVEVWT